MIDSLGYVRFRELWGDFWFSAECTACDERTRGLESTVENWARDHHCIIEAE